MVEWTFNRHSIPIEEKNGFIKNVSLIEHPHGGLISVVSYSHEENTKTFHVKTFYFNEGECVWNPQGETLKFSSIGFNQVSFLNLMGNLQMIYCLDNKLRYCISHDYGKTWKLIDEILEDSVAWKLQNPPIFVGMGRVLLPINDEGSGRCFAYLLNTVISESIFIFLLIVTP